MSYKKKFKKVELNQSSANAKNKEVNISTCEEAMKATLNARAITDHANANASNVGFEDNFNTTMKAVFELHSEIKVKVLNNWFQSAGLSKAGIRLATATTNNSMLYAPLNKYTINGIIYAYVDTNTQDKLIEQLSYCYFNEQLLNQLFMDLNILSRNAVETVIDAVKKLISYFNKFMISISSKKRFKSLDLVDIEVSFQETGLVRKYSELFDNDNNENKGNKQFIEESNGNNKLYVLRSRVSTFQYQCMEITNEVFKLLDKHVEAPMYELKDAQLVKDIHNLVAAPYGKIQVLSIELEKLLKEDYNNNIITKDEYLNEKDSIQNSKKESIEQLESNVMFLISKYGIEGVSKGLYLCQFYSYNKGIVKERERFTALSSNIFPELFKLSIVRGKTISYRLIDKPHCEVIDGANYSFVNGENQQGYLEGSRFTGKLTCRIDDEGIKMEMPAEEYVMQKINEKLSTLKTELVLNFYPSDLIDSKSLKGISSKITIVNKNKVYAEGVLIGYLQSGTFDCDIAATAHFAVTSIKDNDNKTNSNIIFVTLKDISEIENEKKDSVYNVTEEFEAKKVQEFEEEFEEEFDTDLSKYDDLW